jgi:hypothetical protein
MFPIIYPNNRNANPDNLRDYIMNVCQTHKAENRALAFAFIVADLHNPHVNKILNDHNYINALHEISGKTLTVFFLMDDYVNRTIIDSSNSNRILLELGVQPLSGPPSLMPKQLAKILIEEEILQTPCILFFQVEDYNVTDFFITKLRENRIEDGFLEIKDIIEKAVKSLANVKPENRKNSKELFNLIQQEIESSEFWKNANKVYQKVVKLKEFILPFI